MDSNSPSKTVTSISHNYSTEQVAQSRLLEYHIRNSPAINKYSSNEDIAKFKELKYLFITAIKAHTLITPSIVIRAFESLISFYFREGRVRESLFTLVKYKNYLFSKYKATEKENHERVEVTLNFNKFQGFDGDIDNFGKTKIDTNTLVSALNFITSVHFSALKMGIEYEEVTLEINPLYDLAGGLAEKHLNWRENALADAYFQYAEYQLYRRAFETEYVNSWEYWEYSFSCPIWKISRIFRLTELFYGSKREVKSRISSVLANFYDSRTVSNHYNGYKHSVINDIRKIKYHLLKSGLLSEDLLFLRLCS